MFLQYANILLAGLDRKEVFMGNVSTTGYGWKYKIVYLGEGSCHSVTVSSIIFEERQDCLNWMRKEMDGLIHQDKEITAVEFKYIGGD